MWLAPLAQLLALSAMAPPPAAASSVCAQASPQPIATRQTLFAIPFRVAPADRPEREPVEVQLFVSGDQGATWQLYWKSQPEERRFMFRAGADGEFWFLVRTLDRSGRLWPQRPNAPELKVVVDTMPPKLQLRAERGQAGQITAHWQIDDPQANPDSLTIQYRTTSDGPWQKVALDRQTSPTATSPQTDQTTTGQVTWWPHATSGEVQIRAEVSDTAGNLAVNHAQIKAGQDTGAAALTAAAPSSRWHASSETSTSAWPAEPNTGGIGAGDYATAAGPQGTTASYQGYAPEPQTNPTSTGAADLAAADSATQSGTSGYGGDGPTDDPYTADASTPTYPSTGVDTPFSLDNRDQLNPPTGTLTSTVNPPIQNQYVAPGNSQGGAFESGLPPGQRPRMVNSLTFQLEYDVASAGTSGISRVELWGTEDGGRSWKLLALDDDNRSPLTVKVDREGIYGLKVVVTSGTGLGGRRPLPGELPEIVVGVDLTKPTGETTEPVSLDRFRPAAQIRGVGPTKESERTPTRQYYLP